MKIARSTAALMGAFTLSSTLAHSQAILTFQDVKNFRQVGPEDFEYEGGSLDVSLADGSVSFLRCDGINADGSTTSSGGFLTFIAPTVPSCPAGTTGLISEGDFDFDGDGVRDIGLFVSVLPPLQALQVEPFQTALISLIAAPPSDLPRPQGGFSWTDSSTIVFFDQVNDPRNGQAFEITMYNSSRPYTAAELDRQRDEIVPGSYVFTFPVLGSDEDNPRDFPISVAYRPMVEAFPGPSGISVGNDFRLNNDDLWNDGVIEFDPRIVSDFQWEGFNGQTFLTSDRLFIAIRDRDSGLIRFPPFPPGQTAFSQLIGSNTLGPATGFELGPGFFGTNEELTVELEFRRNLAIGNTIDTSVRFFRWDLDLIDSFPGFQRVTFPLGTSEELIDATSDFDGDGFTNLEEFGLQTDVMDPASVPNPTPTIDGITGQCVLEIPKRPGVGSRLVYVVEYSVDLEIWIPIVPGDPNWFIVIDNDEELSVLSRQPATVFPCFTRVRITQN